MDDRLIKAIIHDFVKLLLHFSIPHKTTDVFTQLTCIYLKVKCDDIDWYGGRSCIILKSPSQKSLREEESRYPEDLPKKPPKTSVKNISQGYEDIVVLGQSCGEVLLSKITQTTKLLSRYEEDIQQISSGSTKHKISFWRFP